MKILTICEGGNVRSVGFARILKVYLNHNAIALGGPAFRADYNREPGTMLSRWADQIIFMAEYIQKGIPIPEDCKHKVRVCEVGKDVYGDPFHPDLHDKCMSWVRAEGSDLK